MEGEPLSLCVSLYGDISNLRDVLSYYYGLDEEELFDAGQKITQLRHSVVSQVSTRKDPVLCSSDERDHLGRSLETHINYRYTDLLFFETQG